MRRKHWKLIALAAVVLYLVLKAWCGGSGEIASADELLINRPWIDRMPPSPRDHVHAFVMTDQQQIGAVVHGSAFRHSTDLVRWVQKGGDLEWLFLQDERVQKQGLKVWRCKDAPQPFDLCLTLTRDGKQTRYFSREDWERGALPNDAPDVLKRVSSTDLPELEPR